MQHIFWVIQNQLAGRCGPDRQPWQLADLRTAGFNAVLSVNDGLLCHPEDFKRLGMAYACVPLPPNAPPRPGDFDQCLAALPVAYSFVAEQFAQAHRVLVHCSSGKDRTGLFLAYCLMNHLGQSANEAIANVLTVRPIAYTADGWLDFAFEVLLAAGSDDSFKPMPLCGAVQRQH